jgi:hypothetical protein
MTLEYALVGLDRIGWCWDELDSISRSGGIGLDSIRLEVGWIRQDQDKWD